MSFEVRTGRSSDLARSRSSSDKGEAASYAGRIAYVELKGTDQAILGLSDQNVGFCRFAYWQNPRKSLTFSLDSEIEAAGNQFLGGIFS